MPYKRVGRKIYHKKSGKWKVKQTATSVPKAKATMRLLRGVEHGWKPKGKRYEYVSGYHRHVNGKRVWVKPHARKR